jgi:hypothetical protein
MDLKINQREKVGIRILDLQGRLLIGASEAMLRDAVIVLAKDGGCERDPQLRGSERA